MQINVPLAPQISIHGTYHVEHKHVFGPVDITVRPGAWTCLLGRSGVGKTTLLRLVLGLEVAGEFKGDIRAQDGAPIENRVSYMAQTDLLLPWLSVLENACLGSRLRGEAVDMARAERVIERVGLGAYRNHKPAALSGGMRQRAALARTLMEDRAIVLLDEPFSALDAGTRADMQDLAAEMLKDKTVLLVTHDPHEACRLGAQIIVLSHDGARVWDAPRTAPIRDGDDPETLQAQGALLAWMRAQTCG
ncbi:MAG: ABC transporter ATP-binding protein [Halocynthiibacter sp.]